ncbi:MAG: signal peptidase I [Myxococcales bacterium]|nr:signal peptidase I [Myxococcales bacterium]MCB9531060.1 signal peptidase I [Myxococcales bacterium]MCB9532970.1 signal peptidase I [Myxococcales bacterium]
MSALSEARDLLKESRQLLAKGKPADAARAEIDAAVARLEAAIAAGERPEVDDASKALDAVLTTHLGTLRKSRIREYAESIGVAVLFALTLRGFLFEPFQIPSGSMEPTLLVGDHLFVAKAAYGVRLPFTTRYLYRWSDVSRGDIIVFLFPVDEVGTQLSITEASRRIETYRARNGGYPATLDAAGVPSGARVDAWGRPFDYALQGEGYRYRSAGADGDPGTADDIDATNAAFRGGIGCLATGWEDPKDYIKRVVGLPGDRIELRDDVLYVNGAAIPRDDVHVIASGVSGRPTVQASEHMEGGPDYTTWSLGMSPDFDEITVREGHVFVMGDSRDNSSDGRCWGQVPVDNIKGRAMFMFYSRDRRPVGAGEGAGQVRWSRFFETVR